MGKGDTPGMKLTPLLLATTMTYSPLANIPCEILEAISDFIDSPEDLV